MRVCFQLGRSFAALICFSAALIAQNDGAVISGTIRDSAGAAIPGASVEVSNTATGVIYSTASTSGGTYTVDQLPPGAYAVSITMPGMKPYSSKPLSVEKSSVLRQDAVLDAEERPAYVFPYNPPPVKAAVARPPARDFFDAEAELVFAGPRLSVDGTVIQAEAPSPVKGKIVWIYLPGQGRYLVSLAPHPGFVVSGQVNGRFLNFELPGIEIQIESKDRIAEGSAAYNLYAMHESAWAPPGDASPKARIGSGESSPSK